MKLYLLVVYDISDDGLRLEVARFLKAQGLQRVQRSAFVGPATPALARNIEAGLRRLTRGRQGVNIQLYMLTEACFNSRTVVGDWNPPEEPEVIT